MQGHPALFVCLRGRIRLEIVQTVQEYYFYLCFLTKNQKAVCKLQKIRYNGL